MTRNCNTCTHCPYANGQTPRNGWDLCSHPEWSKPDNQIVKSPDGEPCPCWEPKQSETTV